MRPMMTMVIIMITMMIMLQHYYYMSAQCAGTFLRADVQ